METKFFVHFPLQIMLLLMLPKCWSLIYLFIYILFKIIGLNVIIVYLSTLITICYNTAWRRLCYILARTENFHSKMSNIFMAEFPCRRIPLPQDSLAAEFPCHRIPVRNASPLIVKGMELKSQKCVKDFNHTHVLLCAIKVLLSQNFGQPKQKQK